MLGHEKRKRLVYRCAMLRSFSLILPKNNYCVLAWKLGQNVSYTRVTSRFPSLIVLQKRSYCFRLKARTECFLYMCNVSLSYTDSVTKTQLLCFGIKAWVERRVRRYVMLRFPTLTLSQKFVTVFCHVKEERQWALKQDLGELRVDFGLQWQNQIQQAPLKQRCSELKSNGVVRGILTVNSPGGSLKANMIERKSSPT